MQPGFEDHRRIPIYVDMCVYIHTYLYVCVHVYTHIHIYMLLFT